MSYSKLFEQNRVRIHRKAVSTKILDSIHRLMMEVNENSPRRWVWELIQNAGDAAQGEEVEIFIHLKRDGEGWRLEFSHSGRPFNVLTLTSLVNQVSGKERGPREEGRESTGRFGTGFMTTHLLSRKVEVRSVIQEEGEDCKRFRILLDRSGTTLREIEEGLDLALGELEGLDLVPDCRDLREGELNTVFSYLLDKRGVETALAGIRDLKENVHYMLAFGVGVRGIRLRGVFPRAIDVALHPALAYECCYTPLVMRCLRLSAELAASAELRGIEADGVRTSVHHVGFEARDALAAVAVLAVCAGLCVWGKVA